MLKLTSHKHPFAGSECFLHSSCNSAHILRPHLGCGGQWPVYNIYIYIFFFTTLSRWTTSSSSSCVCSPRWWSRCYRLVSWPTRRGWVWWGVMVIIMVMVGMIMMGLVVIVMTSYSPGEVLPLLRGDLSAPQVDLDNWSDWSMDISIISLPVSMIDMEYTIHTIFLSISKCSHKNSFVLQAACPAAAMADVPAGLQRWAGALGHP